MKLVQCTECGKVQNLEESKHEYGDGYDQRVCSCGDILSDELHGHIYYTPIGDIGYYCKHIENRGAMFGDEWHCKIGKDTGTICPEINTCQYFEVEDEN